ncbi:hypothetical protein [Ferrovibrio sp.]|uniref:hypothetical protein n=1 Tax=Ferrovibrio sp. TaxID=1917215 RepID=UPI0035134DEA
MSRAATPAVLRVIFDSNAYDAILAHGDTQRLRALADAGGIEIVTTHVQEDELRQIADPQRRETLLGLFRDLGGRRVDPAEAIAEDTTHMTRDRMLRLTARACRCLLVTDDRALAATGADVTDYAGFAARLPR